MNFNNYDDLPNHIKARIKRFQGGPGKEWVKQKVPLFANQSVLEIMNREDGEDNMMKHLGELEALIEGRTPRIPT